VSSLERRYLRLVRLFYPAGYRDERGTEIVGTYLALSSPDRHWPSTADVRDLAGGGLRQRLRAAGATGLGQGLQVAAPLALSTATALAGLGVVALGVPHRLSLGLRLLPLAGAAAALP
jgi:hypothetical protein